MNLIDGKWYGSLVPTSHNQDTHSNIDSIVKRNANRTSKIYVNKVWTYQTTTKTQSYPGWEFKTNRTPKAIAEFLAKILKNSTE